MTYNLTRHIRHLLLWVGLLSSVGTLGMGKQEILNNTITGQKHGILTFGGENEIKGNTFLDNREAIYVGPASSAVPNLITTKLELNCNLFQTPGTKWAGLPLTGVYVGQETKFYQDKIAGDGSGNTAPYPGGNAWPLASWLSMPTSKYSLMDNVDPLNIVNGYPAWLSPPNWSSFVSLSSNPIKYFPYLNEFVDVKEDPTSTGSFSTNTGLISYTSPWSCIIQPYFINGQSGTVKEICFSSVLDGPIDYFPLARAGMTNTAHNVEKPSLVIYPNPSSGIFTLTIPDGVQVSQALIKDVAGHLVDEVKLLQTTDQELNLSHLPAGVYFITIDGAAAKPVKLIKQ